MALFFSLNQHIKNRKKKEKKKDLLYVRKCIAVKIWIWCNKDFSEKKKQTNKKTN